MAASELTTEQLAIAINQMATQIGVDIKNLKDMKLNSNSNAVSADKWVTERTIAVEGAATGSVVLDGSANVTLTLTLAALQEASTTESGIVMLSGDIVDDATSESKAPTVKALAETKALMDVLFAKAGAGVNLLTQYVQNFNGVGLGWAVSDVLATVGTIGALKHVRGNVLVLETTNAVNTDAYIYLDDSTTNYDNIQLQSGAKYIYSFYAKAEVTGKQMRCAIKLSDGSFIDTTPTPTAFTDQFVRYALNFTMPAGQTGAVLAFFPNVDAALGTKFHIQGLMLERVISTGVGNYNPSEFKS